MTAQQKAGDYFMTFRAGSSQENRSLVSLGGSKSKSDIAEVSGLAQRSQRIARGHEFVGHVAAEIRGGDAAHNAVPLDFLGAVELVAAGYAAGVEVSDPVDVFLNGADE